MPTKPSKPCRFRGCPAIVPADSPYCEAHTKSEAWSDRRGANGGSARGYGRSWRKLRELVLRGGPLCVACKAKNFIRLATEVDHIVPKFEGGTDTMSNLQPLCRDCHREKTARENGARLAQQNARVKLGGPVTTARVVRVVRRGVGG
jgi:5-methylcytosine-specific restriction protein A